MAHPLSARLVLLAAAFALAAALVLAMVMAEHRDVDAPAAKRTGAPSVQRVAAE